MKTIHTGMPSLMTKATTIEITGANKMFQKNEIVLYVQLDETVQPYVVQDNETILNAMLRMGINLVNIARILIRKECWVEQGDSLFDSVDVTVYTC